MKIPSSLTDSHAAPDLEEFLSSDEHGGRSSEEWWWTPYRSVTNILQNIIQKKETHAGSEQHEGQYTMTSWSRTGVLWSGSGPVPDTWTVGSPGGRWSPCSRSHVHPCTEPWSSLPNTRQVKQVRQVKQHTWDRSDRRFYLRFWAQHPRSAEVQKQS